MDTVIYAEWGAYRDALYPIIKETQSRNNHKFATEIDKALSDDGAFLFVGRDGFFILQPVSDSAVNIMFAYNRGGHAIMRYQSAVEELASFLGVDRLTLQTKVEKLAPALEAEGWEMTGKDAGVYHWAKELGGDDGR